MRKIIVGGVPEHFNLPWKQAIEYNMFQSIDVEIEWRDFHDGTGAMMHAVAHGEVDVALVLTEGAVAYIAKEHDVRIVGTWVDSPLVWGVHAGPHTQKGAQYPHDGRIAISRLGSGSHLMPQVHAHQDGYADALHFVEIGTLAGALTAFEGDEVDAFYWERTMTVPQVEAGQLRLEGDFQAPWPAFVAVRKGAASEEIDAAWVQVLAIMKGFMRDLLRVEESFVADVCNVFSLPVGEVQEWLARTTWASSPAVDANALQRVIDALVRAKVLAQAPALDDLVWRAP